MMEEPKLEAANMYVPAGCGLDCSVCEDSTQCLRERKGEGAYLIEMDAVLVASGPDDVREDTDVLTPFLLKWVVGRKLRSVAEDMEVWAQMEQEPHRAAIARAVKVLATWYIRLPTDHELLTLDDP
jgi:hypothetical protein